MDNDDNDDDASAVATKGKTNKKQKHNISVCCPVLSLSQLFVSQGFTSSVFDTTQPCLDEKCINLACPLVHIYKCSRAHYWVLIFCQPALNSTRRALEKIKHVLRERDSKNEEPHLVELIHFLSWLKLQETSMVQDCTVGKRMRNQPYFS